MNGELQRAKEFLREERLLPENGGLLLCAVSGGMDSMCLLHFLLKEYKNIAVAHFEHGIRAEASAADAAFVEEYCRRLGLRCAVGHGDVPRRVRETGESTEEAARHLRYAFLGEAARALGAEKIALAHHADDNAETLLLHLARGSAAAGLAGMAPERGMYIRPFLTTTRKELAAYAQAQGIVWREDESNADLRYARNRLRARVLPELTALNPNAVDAMTRTMAVQRRENELLNRLAAEALGEVKKDDFAVSAPLRVFAAAESALRPRMLALLMEKSGMGRKDIIAGHFDAALTLIERGGDGALLSLPGAWRLQRKGDCLCLLRAAAVPAPVRLSIGETVPWGKYEISLKKEKFSENRDGQLPLACAMIKKEITVAAPRSGDGLWLAGARGRRSIKRLCTDGGLPPEERDLLPVIYVGEETAAAYRLGTDRAFLPETGEETLLITITEKGETAK